MDLRPRTRKRGSGFTLIELFVVIGIIGILAAIVVPPWRNYRARLNANSAAQAMRSELVRLQAYAIAMEQECTVTIDSTTQYSMYQVNVPTGTIPGTIRPAKRVSVQQDGLVLGPTGKRLVFGPRGWVDTTKTDIVATTLPANLGGYTVYPITVTAPGVSRGAQGDNLTSFTVQTHLNGKVQIQ